MNILVVNAGSSSLKYQLIDMENEHVLAKGNCERIGSNAVLTHKAGDGRKVVIEKVMPTHSEAFEALMFALTESEAAVISSLKEISAVGHRVVQGGSVFSESIRIDDSVIDTIEQLSPLAPLHNPANILGIRACIKALGKDVPQVAVFDTSFHSAMPPKAYMYGVPKKYETELGVRRYGFHGTSHRYVSKRVCEFLGISPVGQRIIICHLGNGSSLSAVVDGKCVDTSMGLTPLEGLLMGTRCGSCDPAVVQFIANNDGKTVDEVLTMMNKQSGLLGISGLSSDMRDIDQAANEGHADAALARDMLVYGIKKYIGSYAAAMGGVDVIAFAGGVGENDWDVREWCLEGLEFMGVKLDKEKNNGRGEEKIITTPDSKVTAMVVLTNEELMIARETAQICGK